MTHGTHDESERALFYEGRLEVGRLHGISTRNFARAYGGFAYVLFTPEKMVASFLKMYSIDTIWGDYDSRQEGYW